ncbi:putative hsp70 family protein [Botrytis fragariae]|uniref:Putative hsp70 family protein n=1 Tax=Botrytis fragariae TaxID=1964551 RepID=A0A8H6EK30_9HELO|nr:putative hsp70 family protein [Botrytis fragariae]KAF5875099.1 putative hsp70 family protein [Botrytis fragariae]
MFRQQNFLKEQLELFSELKSHILPSKFFFLGGDSNSSILHEGIKEIFHVLGLPNVDLVALGTCDGLAFIILELRYQYLTMNSATIIFYGAMLQALRPTNSFTKSHYCIGIRREEPHRKLIHVSPLDEDDIPAKRMMLGKANMIKQKSFSGSAFIFMEEILDEIGSMEDPWYKVPVSVYICSRAGDVQPNSATDVENDAGKQGWSFESQIPAGAKVYNFEWDLGLAKEDSLFDIKQIPPLKTYYTINWAILAETTSIGMNIWFMFHPDGRTMSKTDEIESLRREEVQKVVFADLVEVIQKEYGDDSKGKDQRKDKAR